MTTPVINQSTNRAGLCPHGLPPAACPICSGGGMGGTSKMKDVAPMKQMHSTEWSFMKCYAVGLAMRANEQRAENAKTDFERQIEFAKQLSKSIQNIADKIKSAIENIQNSIPKIAANIVSFVSNVVIMPILNIISVIPKIIEKMVDFQKYIGTMLLQAGEKLVAILGDIKNFIERKIIDNLKKQAKKFFMFFVSNTEDENYKNDDILAVFKSRELKKYIVEIIGIKKKRDKDANRRIKNK